MLKILFVCHGNICRSPMAEMLMKNLVKNSGLEKEFFIESAACRTDEIGSPIHRGTVLKLKEKNVSFTDHRARLITQEDYTFYDLIIAMDEENMRDLERKFAGDKEKKCHKLLEYAGLSRDVADPWYTGDFDETYRDVEEGLEGFLNYLREKGEI